MKWLALALVFGLCAAAYCPDGIIDSGEECDDDNYDNGASWLGR
jgi:hypothetical protein